jgi:Flp pilus assembly protein TadG
MKKSRQLLSTVNDQRGATAVVVAIVITVLIAFVALATDVGYLSVTKNELQNIADAAALAGSGELGNIYNGLSYDDQQVLTLDENQVVAIRSIAKDVVGEGKNRAAGKNIVINDSDIFINKWPGTSVTTNDYTRPNAVRVTARRDSSANGPISTFFAKIFGVDTLEVSADATAALTGLASGNPTFPVGISKHWFDVHDGEWCNKGITLHPTGDKDKDGDGYADSCAGWHTYKDWNDYKAWPANASKLRDILDGLREGTFEIPLTYPGDEYVFIGGDVASAFDEMQALFNQADKENFNGVEGWKVSIPVYDSEDCGNPSGNIRIVGFATALITEVIGPPDKVINAIIQCDYVEIGKGGGPGYGTSGTISNLVE